MLVSVSRRSRRHSSSVARFSPALLFVALASPLAAQVSAPAPNPTTNFGVPEGALPAQNPKLELLEPSTAIALHSGEVIHSRADLAIEGRALHFALVRTYRSQLDYTGDLGPGWTHSLDHRIWSDGNGGVRHLDADRFSLDEYPSAGGSSPIDCVTAGVYRKARALSGGKWEIRDRHGRILRFHALDGTADAGRLDRIVDTHGSELVVRYNALGQISTVECDSYNALTNPTRRVDFAYVNGRIAAVTDVHNGRVWQYAYNEAGELAQVASPSVDTLTGSDTAPLPRTTSYTYEASPQTAEEHHNLVTIVYPGQSGPTVDLRYDAGDHVETAYVGEPNVGGGQASFDFVYQSVSTATGAILETKALDRRGHSRRYQFGPDALARTFVDPTNGTSTFTFNGDGEVLERTYPNGNRHVISYASSTSTDRFQHGNILETAHAPAPGRPGSDKTNRVRRRYEPIYNTERSTLAEGGTYVFDYQENPSTVAPLISAWAIAAGTLTPLGDVNGDGRTDLHGGSIIETTSRSITKGLPAGGPSSLVRVQTWTHDDFGRVASYADEEGALMVYSYTGDYLTTVVEDFDPDPAGCPNSAGSFPNSGISRWSRACSVEHVQARTHMLRDGRGNILTLTDPRGVQSTFSYNALDEIETSAVGADFDPAYLDSRLAGIVAAGYGHLVEPALTQSFRYDAAGDLVRLERDNRGSGDIASPVIVTETEYDREHRIKSVSESLGAGAAATTMLVYDASGNQIRVTNAMGNVTATLYDAHDRVQEEREGAGPTGAVIAGTAVTRTHYDANGRVVRVEGPEDRDANGLGDATVIEHDGRNRIHRIITAVGTETTYEYTSRGWLYKETRRGKLNGASGANNSTAGNAVLAVLETDQDETGFEVSAKRYVFAHGSAPGSAAVLTQFRRDRRGQAVDSIDDAGRKMAYVYDGMGRVVSSTDDLGNIVSYKYDDGGYPVETTFSAPDPVTGVPVVRTRYETYDGLGRRIRSVYGDEVHYYAYDALGREVVHADGRSMAAGADPFGIVPSGSLAGVGATVRRSFVQNAQGFECRVMSDMYAGGSAPGSYDLWAQNLNPALAPSGVLAVEVSTIQVDKAGRVASVTTAGSRHLTFGYDAHGRMTTKTYPDGSSTLTSYWRDGLVRKHEHFNSSGALFRGTVTNYDGDGRKTSVFVTASPTGYGGTNHQTFQWNGLDRLTRLTDNKIAPDLRDSVVHRNYDSLGRVRSETQNGLTVTKHYDDLYDRGFRFPGGRRIERTRDALGRIDQIREGVGGSAMADYSYYGNGSRVASTAFGNSSSKSFQVPVAGSGLANGYSPSARALRMEHRGPGGTVLAVLQAAFDPAGNRVARARTAGGTTVVDTASYDSRSRIELFQKQVNAVQQLVSGILRNGDGDWTALGLQENGGAPSLYTILSSPDDWAYDSIAGRSLDHDTAGNRTQDDWFNYEYDVFDRLIRVTDRYSGAAVASYSYDAETRRIEKQTWVDGTTRFLYEGPRIVETRNAAGAVKDQYVHGVWIDELVQWTAPNGNVYHYLTDELHSVVALTDASGAIVERVAYDAFGAPTFLDASGGIVLDTDGYPVAVSPLGNRFLLHGRDYDGEVALWRRAQETPSYFAQSPGAGQYNFRYRYASPDEGRFTSRDPLAIASNSPIDPSILVGRIMTGESESPYEFASGSPITRRDPLGLSTIQIKPGRKSKGIDADEFEVPDVEASDFTDGEFLLGLLEVKSAFEGLVGGRIGDAIVSHVSCGEPPLPSTGVDPPSSGGPNGRPKDIPPNGRGNGGSRLGGNAGVVVGTVAAAVVSVATIEHGQGNSAFQYLIHCTNPFTDVGSCILSDLESRIGNGPGLPQPGSPPGVKEKSMKLFKEYWVARAMHKASKTRQDPKGDSELKDTFMDLLKKGKAMSCVYFSRNSILSRHVSGPIANLDCKPMWAANQGALVEPAGEGEEEESTPPAGGGGNNEEFGWLESPPDVTPREAALARFDGRASSEPGSPRGPLSSLVAVGVSALWMRSSLLK